MGCMGKGGNNCSSLFPPNVPRPMGGPGGVGEMALLTPTPPLGEAGNAALAALSGKASAPAPAMAPAEPKAQPKATVAKAGWGGGQPPGGAADPSLDMSLLEKQQAEIDQLRNSLTTSLIA